MERLAVRLALAARHPSDSLRPPPQRLAQVRQQERQDRCPKAGRAAASWDVKAGLPRSAQRAPVEGTQSQLSHSRTRQPPRDEPDQSDLPEPGDPRCAGQRVYSLRYRVNWLEQLREPGLRQRAALLYQQLDGVQTLRKQARRALLAESRKHPAHRLLLSVPGLGLIRVALLLALMQTPHRFRSKRQLWAYAGLALVTPHQRRLSPGPR